MLHRQTGLKRLIFAHAAAGGELPPINEYTATGNPSEFSTNLIRPLQSFEIPFIPVQSGSGIPSPSNIRPISGWAGVTINANNNLLMIEWQSVAGTVYGGTLDAVTGILTAEYGAFTVDQNSVIDGNAAGDFLYIANAIPAIKPYQSYSVPYGFCDKIEVVADRVLDRFVTRIGGLSGSTFYNNLYFFNVAKAVPSATDLASAIAALKAIQPTVIYQLATPQTFQLSPVEVRTIIGQNSIGTNTNGTNTIKYLKRG